MFEHLKHDFETFRVRRIPSLFDEIGIELCGQQKILVPEGADGFFELAEVLDLEGVFGPLWYRDAEDGRELCHHI
jgi:hypothetical protein